MGERMSGVDAAWLHMDRPTNRMVIHCVLWFDQPVDWAAAMQRVRERLVTPYRRRRQRVAEPLVPLGLLAVPQWVDDPGFRLENHVRHVTLPAPGDTEALHRYIGEQVPRALDPAHALWELHCIDGYRGGSALLLRLHHAVADGIALMQLLVSLSDEGAAARAPGGVDAEPGDVLTTAGAAIRRAADAGLALVARGRTMLAEPATLGDLVAMTNASALSLGKLGLMQPDAGTVLRGDLGTVKRVGWCRPVPLRAVKILATRTGSTVNDVMLASISGALRRYLLAHDSLVDEIGAVVPFNVRPPDEPVGPELGNQFGLVFPALPVGLADGRARIAAVKRAMDAIKLGRQGQISCAWLSAVGRAPAQLENALIDLYSAMGSVVVTNVVGPRATVSLAGTPATGLLAWVPTSGPVGVGLSIISYDGRVTLGLVVDARVVPDDDRLLAALEAELDVFRAAEPSSPPPSTR